MRLHQRSDLGAVDFSTSHPPLPSLDYNQYLLNQYTILDPNFEMVRLVYDLQSYLNKNNPKSPGVYASYPALLKSLAQSTLSMRGRLNQFHDIER